MVWDAVSNHKLGKLSLSVFKKHIRASGSISGLESESITHHHNGLVNFGERLPTLKQAENLLIEEAMRRSGANQAVAAMHLGISRQALNRRIRQKQKKI
jgi:transcriptional regulator with PAS, ATPase and Fis domain